MGAPWARHCGVQVHANQKPEIRTAEKSNKKKARRYGPYSEKGPPLIFKRDQSLQKGASTQPCRYCPNRPAPAPGTGRNRPLAVSKPATFAIMVVASLLILGRNAAAEHAGMNSNQCAPLIVHEAEFISDRETKQAVPILNEPKDEQLCFSFDNFPNRFCVERERQAVWRIYKNIIRLTWGDRTLRQIGISIIWDVGQSKVYPACDYGSGKKSGRLAGIFDCYFEKSGSLIRVQYNGVKTNFRNEKLSGFIFNERAKLQRENDNSEAAEIGQALGPIPDYIGPFGYFAIGIGFLCVGLLFSNKSFDYSQHGRRQRRAKEIGSFLLFLLSLASIAQGVIPLLWAFKSIDNSMENSNIQSVVNRIFHPELPETAAGDPAPWEWGEAALHSAPHQLVRQ